MYPYGKSGIYEIRCKVTDDAYVGSSRNIGRRWYGHRARLRNNIHPTKHLQNAWNKYGEENFEFSIVEFCDVECLVDREQVYLDSGAYIYNKATKAYNPMAGAKLSPEHVEALRRHNTGKVRSEATRRLMSESQKRDKARPEYKAAARERMLGKAVPQEVRDKISATLKGRPLAPEVAEKVAEANRRRIAEEGVKEGSLQALAAAIEKRKGRERNPEVVSKCVYSRHGLVAANKYRVKKGLEPMTEEQMVDLFSSTVKEFDDV